MLSTNTVSWGFEMLSSRSPELLDSVTNYIKAGHTYAFGQYNKISVYIKGEGSLNPCYAVVGIVWFSYNKICDVCLKSTSMNIINS